MIAIGRNVITLAVLGLASASALAAPSYCVPGPNADGLAVNDMTFEGASAADCYGVNSGNPADDGSALDGITNWLDSDYSWTFLAKDDNPGSPGVGSGSFAGLEFTLTATAGTEGEWTLSWTDEVAPPASLPTEIDFVAVLKASTEWNAYLFENVPFAAAPGSGSGTWKIVGITNKNGIPAALSHLSLYVRSGAGGEVPPSGIPEPGSLLLLGLGLPLLSRHLRSRKSRA
jgi:hypothetical protein